MDYQPGYRKTRLSESTAQWLQAALEADAHGCRRNIQRDRDVPRIPVFKVTKKYRCPVWLRQSPDRRNDFRSLLFAYQHEVRRSYLRLGLLPTLAAAASLIAAQLVANDP